MISVGSYQAKTHFAELLDQVARGEQVVITKHRVPVARLIPEANCAHQSASEAIAAIQRFRRGRHLPATELAEMIRAGRR